MLGSLVRELFKIRTLVFLFGLVALALLIWFFGPGIELMGGHPLASKSARAAVIIGLVVVLLVIALVRFLLIRRANSRLIKNLIESDELASMATSDRDEELEIIRERFQHALEVLKQSTLGGTRGGRFLYELPWYVLIGAPGTGKTTILNNSGLDFPLSDRFGSDAVQGFGGTRHCDWWFTDKAILIDTAGRYTTQDVNRETDRAAWLGFLDILRNHRRRRPINGALLLVSAADLLDRSENERRMFADTLRRRLQELVKAFEVSVPVYLVVTKTDLVSGFNEFFADLREDEREQVFGVTLPADTTAVAVPSLVDQRLGELFARIEEQAPEKLHAERNLERRARIFLFPRELAAFQASLTTFVRDVFRTSRYEKTPQLRGVYLTSGTQEGTPIDRLLGAFSRRFGLSPGQVVPYSGRGKAFFIHRLLTDIVFQEADLIGTNRRLEASLVIRHVVGYAAAAVLFLGLSFAMIHVMAHSHEQINAVNQELKTTEATLKQLQPNPTLEELLPLLNSAGRLASTASVSGALPLIGGMGLDAYQWLGSSTSTLYNEILSRKLLPAVEQRLAARVAILSQSENEADMPALRQSLRAYMMLNDPQRFDASYLLDTLKTESQRLYPLQPQNQANLDTHFQQLVGELPQAVPFNQRLVQAAQRRLATVPPMDEMYASLVRKANADGSLQPFVLTTAIGTTALTTDPSRINAAQPILQIPGLYTRDGFYNFFLKQAPNVVQASLDQDWIAGRNATKSDTYQSAMQSLVKAYVSNYISIWQKAVDQVTVVDFSSVQRAQQVLQTLASPDTPLIRLAKAVQENTQLPIPGTSGSDNSSGSASGAAAGAAANAAGGGSTGGAVASAAQGLAGKALGAAAQQAFGNMAWPGDQIARPFQPIVALLGNTSGGGGSGGGASGPTLPQIQQSIGAVYGDIDSIAAAPDPDAAAFKFVSQRVQNQSKDALTDLRTDAAVLPGPYDTILKDISTRSWDVLIGLAYGDINANWQQQVIPQCNSLLDNRFPVANSKNEVTLKDFTEMFRKGGVIDQFYTTYMAPFVTRQGGNLVAASIDGRTLGFSVETLNMFERAERIQQAFFSGGTALGVKFSITPSFLDPAALRSVFTLDGDSITYRHGPPRTSDMTWPNRGDASTASVIITLVEGGTVKEERTGAWALFRLLYTTGMSRSGASDQYTFSVVGKNNVRASYAVQASSVVNPLAPGLILGFSCPGNL